jgi:prepilin-type N-terminal cleavage/methylation domain-containing protein
MKTQPPSPLRTRAAFTLIEILVVMTIIAVLVALALPAMNMVMDRLARTRTQHTMQAVITATRSYMAEYNRFPMDPNEAAGGSQEDVEAFRTDGTGGVNSVINILMADTGDTQPNMNSRKIKFVDLPMAKNNLFGVMASSGSVGDGNDLKLVDMWGQAYWIQFDTNYDNRIQNPDKQNIDQIISNRATDFVTAPIIMYSGGKDKQQQTKDDIVSWR